MSIRTILEINHDYLFLLEKDPEIMKKISRLIQGYPIYSSDHIALHWPAGLRPLGTRHHSETLKLTVK